MVKRAFSSAVIFRCFFGVLCIASFWRGRKALGWHVQGFLVFRRPYASALTTMMYIVEEINLENNIHINQKATFLFCFEKCQKHEKQFINARSMRSNSSFNRSFISSVVPSILLPFPLLSIHTSHILQLMLKTQNSR